MASYFQNMYYFKEKKVEGKGCYKEINVSGKLHFIFHQILSINKKVKINSRSLYLTIYFEFIYKYVE